MSEYTSYTYATEPAVSQGDVASAAGLTGLSSTASVASSSIASMSQRFEQRLVDLRDTGLSTPEAALTALVDYPILAATIASGDGSLFTSSASPTSVERAISAARSRLLDAETSVLKRHFSAALVELGYSPRPPRRQASDSDSLFGTRGDGASVALRVSARHGRVEVDLSGFAGMSCSRERERLGAALRRRGVMLTEISRQGHGCVDGGVLTSAIRPGDSAIATGTQRVARQRTTS